MNLYRRYFKRVIDVVIAATALIFFLPVILVIVIVLFFQNKGKIFFIQERPGLHQRPFKVLKFKTMTDECDSNGNLLPDVKRITSFGRFLRKSSLDELPQFFNVLKGEMSVVGPRPLLCMYIPLHQPWQLVRYEVRPGITGWAQVNGRNSLTWTHKFQLDVEYVEKCSALLDFKILLFTFSKVINSQGVQKDKDDTMPLFNGNN